MSNLYPEDWNEVHLSLDYKTRRNNYWVMLKRARHDYHKLVKQEGNDPNDGSFYIYMESQHGLRVILEGGLIGAHYEIVDEKKYVMFLMKYGS